MDPEVALKAAVECLSEGRVECLRELLPSFKAIIDEPRFIMFGKWKQTILTVAVSMGDYECVKELLSFGCNVDAVNEQGFTPLFLAVSNYDVEMVELLLTFEPSTTITDRFFDDFHASLRAVSYTHLTLPTN